MLSVEGSREPRLKILDWRPLVKNTLRGFAKVRLPIGLVIRDVSVHISHGKAWAAMPSAPRLDRDGRQMSEDGRKLYNFLLEWDNRALSEGFSAAVVAVLDRDRAGWRG